MTAAVNFRAASSSSHSSCTPLRRRSKLSSGWRSHTA